MINKWYVKNKVKKKNLVKKILSKLFQEGALSIKKRKKERKGQKDNEKQQNFSTALSTHSF